jgi:carbamoyl-phosphate synthase small subunit
MSFKPGGVLLSNGPGDPKDVIEQTKAIKNLIGKLPIMGVCLGHQLLALHMGGDTYKLKYGHRGANHPAQDVRTGKVWITSQNHGYSVSKDNIPEGMAITHINLNDNTVEGMRHLKYPILSVQFHPEGSPGPKDSEEIFDEFLKLVYVYGKGEYHEKRIS